MQEIKNYLVSYKDKSGVYHNGIFTGRNLTELRKQFIDEVGEGNQILSIIEQ